MKVVILSKIMIEIIVIVLTLVHFALVLYSHMLNAPLQKREGGCKDNETSDREYEELADGK